MGISWKNWKIMPRFAPRQIADREVLAPERRARRVGIAVISGDDFTTVPMLAIGAVGVISVTANIVPGEMSEMVNGFMEGRREEALSLHYRLAMLHRSMFIETNPVPVKTALAMMGRIEEEFRLPLVRISDANRAALLGALKTYGLGLARV